MTVDSEQVACVFSTSGSSVKPKEVLLSLPKRLWPERIEIIDEIPKTLMGKVRRNVLTDELACRMA